MLRHDFSKETDVRAFGFLASFSSMTLKINYLQKYKWGIYKNGDITYRGLSNLEIQSFVIHIKDAWNSKGYFPSGTISHFLLAQFQHTVRIPLCKELYKKARYQSTHQ
ncbi:unnamed protein product [Brugia pahangi]|uniref:GUN4 domain-containing protein n=1 Tax=Brugia pahangi TaxID=6280 RepID=A0A0N4TMP3_BRUPA|nr:unnamed protein product [Brugia pahangi]